MDAHQDQNIVIVSDLHLSSGRDPHSGVWDPGEEFRYDDAFAGFLRHICERANNDNARWRLLILGDLFDFPRVTTTYACETGRFLDRSVDAALDRLERIAKGHPEFFAALRDFLAAGCTIDVVAGNHDIELLYRPVQNLFRDLVLAHVPSPTQMVGGISFYPWMYYIEGLVYAEHGQQYEPLSSFDTLLRPYYRQDATDIVPPFGAHFDQYIADLAEATEPPNGFQPELKHLVRSWATNPSLFVKTLPYHKRLLASMVTGLVKMLSPRVRLRRKAYREKVLPRYSSEVGLRRETLEEIDNVRQGSAAAVVTYLLERLALDPAVRLAPVATSALLAYCAPGKGATRGWLLALFMSGLLWFGGRRGRRGEPVTQLSRYVVRAARAIHLILQSENKAVPFYVFGHTHEPMRARLISQPSAPYYLNSGTWKARLPAIKEGSRRADRFPFVEIIHRPQTGTVTAGLFLWNPATGRAERMREPRS